jgi:regulatory protein
VNDSGTAGKRVTPAVPDDPESVSAAEDVALRILRGAAQSARGLQQRLQRRGFSEHAAAQATLAMVSLGYVDDAALATSLAARGQRTGHGRIQVAARLRARGIDDGDIAATLAAVDAEDERAAALALGRRLFGRAARGLQAMDRRRRVFGQLQRRGFDTETVHWVLRQLEAVQTAQHSD